MNLSKIHFISLVKINLFSFLLLAANSIISAPHISVDNSLAGMAYASDGSVYSWYKDGTYTKGSETDLDMFQSPEAFATPPDHLSKIIGMAILGQDIVFTWYYNGSYTVGTPSNLSSYLAPTPYFLPSGKQRRDKILGMVMSNTGVVSTYYSDGMYAQGYASNLGAYVDEIPFLLDPLHTPAQIMALALDGNTNNVSAWFEDGIAFSGDLSDLSLNRFGPFSQHITLYSFLSDASAFVANTNPSTNASNYKVVRDDLPDAHEPVLAPGFTNIAIAKGHLAIYEKASGDQLMSMGANQMFAEYLDGSSDEVLDINSHSGLGDCANDYPKVDSGLPFCIQTAYDTRAAYSPLYGRYVFLANFRNRVWSASPGPDDPAGTCIKYKDDNDNKSLSNENCNSFRRNLAIAVSVSENPADGFHLYAITEFNYRDWPLLTLHGDRVYIGQRGSENPDGFAALAFSMEELSSGIKRPQYFRIDSDDIGTDRIIFPRDQPDGVFTVGIGANGDLYSIPSEFTTYQKPKIHRHASDLSYSQNWVYKNNQLTLAKSVPSQISFDSSTGKKKPGKCDIINLYLPQSGLTELKYCWEKEKIRMTKISVVESNAGVIPINVSKDSKTLAKGDYATLGCARLAIANNGRSLVSFVGGVPLDPYSFTADSLLRHDAAFIEPPSILNITNWQPQIFRAGDFGDPYSVVRNMGSEIEYSEEACQQQGGAAADPYENNRIWIMQNFGSKDEYAPVFGAALGYIELN